MESDDFKNYFTSRANWFGWKWNKINWPAAGQQQVDFYYIYLDAFCWGNFMGTINIFDVWCISTIGFDNLIANGKIYKKSLNFYHLGRLFFWFHFNLEFCAHIPTDIFKKISSQINHSFIPFHPLPKFLFRPSSSFNLIYIFAPPQNAQRSAEWEIGVDSLGWEIENYFVLLSNLTASKFFNQPRTNGHHQWSARTLKLELG